MNYFLIPGNPPATHFYKLWGEEIRSLSPQAMVKVCHYPTLARTHDSATFMADVLAYHRQQLTRFYEECRGPITLLGHSLGGYFSLKLLEESVDIINQTILLHPFLRMPQKKGQFILKMAGALQGQDGFQTALIKNRRLLEMLFNDLSFITEVEIKNTFQIAKHEWNIIGTDQSPPFIQHEHREKVQIFYHPRDIWCSPSVVKSLRDQVSLLPCTEPHGFITSQKHRETLLRKILNANKLS